MQIDFRSLACSQIFDIAKKVYYKQLVQEAYCPYMELIAIYGAYWYHVILTSSTMPFHFGGDDRPWPEAKFCVGVLILNPACLCLKQSHPCVKCTTLERR